MSSNVHAMNISDLKKPLANDFCLLCGGKPFFVGIFVPANPQVYGAAEGKTRLIRYCLCDTCKEKSDTPGKVEKVIFAELIGGGIHAQ
jgi:hypothetical protein